VPRQLTFPQIDVLRGFAAISVVVYHVIELLEWTAFPEYGPLLWFRVGWMGVDLFFVISGFVISLASFAMLDRASSRDFRLPFMKRRFLRIAPLHYLACLVFLAFSAPALVFQPGSIMNFVSHIGFFHNMNWRWSHAINAPNWSIGVEMQFYVLIVLLAPLMRNCRWWMIPAVAVPIAWAWRYGAFALVPLDDQAGPWFRFWASTQLPGSLDQFAVGVLLARLFRSGEGDKLVSFCKRFCYLPPFAAGLAIWATMILYWPRHSFWDNPAMIVFWRSFESLSFGLVVFAACCAMSPTMLAVTRPLRYFGTISYGIYLWHWPIILSVKNIEGLTKVKALALTIGLTLIFAAASWHFFERSFLRPKHLSRSPETSRPPQSSFDQTVDLGARVG
jgi:peptidoglycan/LPS O-acetylase OafA/YrhL